MQIGDLVRMKKNLYNIYKGPLAADELVGIVIAIGTEERRMYGDGIQSTDYVEVKWLNKQYDKVARYSPPYSILEVISESRKPS